MSQPVKRRPPAWRKWLRRPAVAAPLMCAGIGGLLGAGPWLGGIGSGKEDFLFWVVLALVSGGFGAMLGAGVGGLLGTATDPDF